MCIRGSIGLIGGCVMVGDGHKRLNRPNWGGVGGGIRRGSGGSGRVCDGG